MLDPNNSLLNTIIFYILFILSLHIAKPKMLYENKKKIKFPYYPIVIIVLFILYFLFQTIKVIAKYEINNK